MDGKLGEKPREEWDWKTYNRTQQIILLSLDENEKKSKYNMD